MKIIFKTVTVAVVLSTLLGGCAVYGPPPAYSQGPYAQPGPVYAQPAPVYIAPPVSFGFNFGYWGGGGHHRRW